MKKKSLVDPYGEREAAKYENPIPSREFISQILAAAKGPITIEVLFARLELQDEVQADALRRRVRAMERDGQLITNRKGELGLTEKMDLVRGRVQGHREGFGFVIPYDGSPDIYLTQRQMQKVMDGDEVLALPGKTSFKGRAEGKIIEVLSRNTKQLVGRYLNQGGNHFVKPDNPRNIHDIFIPPQELAGAQPGQFVMVEITQFPDTHNRPLGKIVEVLGDHMAPGMEIDVAIRSYGIPNVWPDDVLKESECFSNEVSEKDKHGRVDLRDLPFVTIDGEDARDFDDAVYCEAKPAGGWRLYVAIADVSHYVKPGSALDSEALVRGNSVYFPDFVVPMLPHVLSNGLCSLNPQVDRLCMVCEITVSVRGKISGYKFYEAVIHSHARLTYTKVGDMIESREKARSPIRKEYAELLPHIDELYQLYLALREARKERGAIDFDTKETRIIFDDERKIKEIIPIQRNEAHKLIEECMLAANVCTARFLEAMKIPTLYRVHEGPNDDKLALLHEFLGGLGLSMKGKGKVEPQDYCDVLQSVVDRPDAHLIQTVMLRSMNQARYQVENLGHFGLAFPAYSHFTSPIRRYPDLIVHRAIRALIRAAADAKKIVRQDSVKIEALEKNYPYDEVEMVAIGEQCSITERRADEATRDVVSWLKCEYLRERVGEQFDGVVSSVTGFGLFVELNDLYVEGLVHITALPQDYYHFNPAQHRLVGERSGKAFRLGDQLRVQVVRVDLDERKIDFELIKVKSSGKREDLPATGKAKTKTSAEAAPGRNVRKRAAKADDAPAAGDEKPEKSSARRRAKKSSASKTKKSKTETQE